MSVFAKITRRDFLRQAGVGTGALVFGCHISPQGLFAEGLLGEQALNPFVAIVPVHGTIIISSHRSEMGQGIRSSLAAVLADELEADWGRVVVRPADADGPRYALDNKFYIPVVVPDYRKFIIWDKFSQFTDSSRSMALYYLPMRLFGAGIRLVLLRAAASKFGGVDLGECEARRHKVVHTPTGRALDYGDLRLLLEAQEQTQKGKVQPTQDEVTPWLKPSKKWHFIGNKDTMPFVDAHDMVTGKAVYGADADPQVPGMLTASIERCPVANGRLVSFDPTAALAVPGVRKVLAVLPPGASGGGVGTAFLPHAGVAVLADNTWAAIRGRRALKPKIEWDLRPAGFPLQNADYQSDAYRLELHESTGSPGMKLRSRGDVDAVFAQAPPVVERCYYVPHLAQAPMEPPAAIARFANGRWEIWAPTQSPDITQKWVGQIVLGVPPEEWLDLKVDTITKIREKVTVHVTLLGGGFGRKSKPDYVVEAALLATQNPGVPIRVQWTREDDIKFSYYNAVSHQYLKAAVDGEGKATALLWRSAFTSFFATVYPPPDFAGTDEKKRENLKRARAEALQDDLGYGAGGEYPHGSRIEFAQGLEDMPFDVKNLRIENCEAKSHIRVGWMRSVANIYHAFAICSFADELAVEARCDSKEYLLGLIGPGGPLDLKAEGVEHFDNNGFPVEPLWRLTPDGQPVRGPDGQPIPVLFGYPPDSRRLRAVVERVARNAGWDDKVKQYKAVPNGRGLGIAAHRSFLSYVAMVFDVSLGEPKGPNQLRELTIHDVYAVIDCGIAVNPDRVKAQLEGGIVYGLSLALLGEITVKDGKVEQNNFDDYPVLRIHQMPKNISIDIMEPPDPDKAIPTGVGEPPVPPVAPALANAIVAAGGPRIREVPFYRAVQVL
jgi:isoquinoline 1-oxidoreductase beta subunit